MSDPTLEEITIDGAKERLARVKSDLANLEDLIKTATASFREAKASLQRALEAKDSEGTKAAKELLDRLDGQKNTFKNQRYMRWSDQRELESYLAAKQVVN